MHPKRTRIGSGRLLWLGLLGLLLPLAARAADVTPMQPDDDIPLVGVPIGKPGDYKDYVPIERGTRLQLYGPGTLTFYIRAHVSSQAAPPETVWVSLSGIAGLRDRRWTREVAPSPVSVYGDGRVGTPTGGKRIAVEIPAGLQRTIVMAASDSGDPVYAHFYYDGPPVPPELLLPEPPAAEAPARPAEPQRRPSPWGFDADYSLDLIYDDNICRYSDATLEEFKSGAEPEHFAIEAYDDLIINNTLQAELSHKSLLFGKRIRFRARYKHWQYARNDIKSNDEINMRLRQYVRRSDYLEFQYTYAPNSYIKELGDRPPFVSRRVAREYKHFYITRNMFLAGYYWRAKPWLKFKFEGERVLRFYNRPFLENDLWEWNGEITTYVDYHRLDFWLAYKYSDVAARAYDSVGETLETSDNDSDGSYDKDNYRLRVIYNPKRSPYRPGTAGDGLLGALAGGAKKLGSQIDRGLVKLKTRQLYSEIAYTRQFYTSERPLDVDPLHVGRLDESRQVRLVWVSRPLWRGVSTELGWRYTVRTADAPAGLIGEDDPSEEKDYTGNRYWMALDYPLN